MIDSAIFPYEYLNYCQAVANHIVQVILLYIVKSIYLVKLYHELQLT